VSCLLDDCDCMVFRAGLCWEHWELAWEDDLLPLPRARQLSGPQAAKREPKVTVQQQWEAIRKGRVFVYVLTDGEKQKIGYSQNPGLRVSAITAELGRPVELVYLQPAKYSRLSERAAHFLLRHNRITGEWFHCTQTDAIAAVVSAVADHYPDGMGKWTLPKRRRKFIHDWNWDQPMGTA